MLHAALGNTPSHARVVGQTAVCHGRPSKVAEIGLCGRGGGALAHIAAGDVGRPRIAQEGPIDGLIEGVRLDLLCARVRAQPLGRVALQQLRDQVLPTTT